MIELKRIANDVYGLSILIVNEYAFSQSSGEWMLVDCGLSLEWNLTSMRIRSKRFISERNRNICRRIQAGD